MADTNAIGARAPSTPEPDKQAVNPARRILGDPLLWLALGLGVAACLAVINHVPYVNGPTGPKQWQWPYRHRDVYLQSCFAALRLLVPGAASIGCVTWLLCRCFSLSAAKRRIRLTALVLWGFFFVWVSLITATPMRLAHLPRIVKSQTWTSYFTLAQWISNGRRPPLGETLQRYAELLPDLPLHTSTHPPGAVIASYGLLRVFQNRPSVSSALGDFYQKIGTDPNLVGVESFTADEVTATSLAVLVVAVGLLCVFPLFGLVRRAMREVAEDGRDDLPERTAWAAAALWVHYPALVLMVPAFDLLYPAGAVLCVYFTLRGLTERPALWGAALGMAFMAGITFTFTLLLLAPMLFLMAWLELAQQAGSLRLQAVARQTSPRLPAGRRLWILVGTTLVVCFLVDACLRLLFGIHLMQIFFAAVRNQNETLLPKLNRTYKVWVFYNVWDFLLFAGLPLAVLALAWFGRAFREWWSKPATIIPAVAIFPMAVLGVDLSHQLSAETARVWLFLAPGIAWAGAAELVCRYGTKWRWMLAGLLVLQTAFIYACRTNMMLWGF